MKFQKLAWNKEAETALFPVMAGDCEFLKNEVKNNISELYCIDDKSYMITRIEGDRLVVCCYVGENINEVAKFIYHAAKQANCKSVQFHTERPGLKKLLKDFEVGYVSQYYIYEVVVH